MDDAANSVLGDSKYSTDRELDKRARSLQRKQWLTIALKVKLNFTQSVQRFFCIQNPNFFFPGRFFESYKGSTINVSIHLALM